jgi:hypothetical protein
MQTKGRKKEGKKGVKAYLAARGSVPEPARLTEGENAQPPRVEIFQRGGVVRKDEGIHGSGGGELKGNEGEEDMKGENDEEGICLRPSVSPGRETERGRRAHMLSAPVSFGWRCRKKQTNYYRFHHENRRSLLPKP